MLAAGAKALKKPESVMERRMREAGLAKGGKVKCMAAGGKVRGVGCAAKGHGKGKMR
jgi:nitrogenase subunit NifH